MQRIFAFFLTYNSFVAFLFFEILALSFYFSNNIDENKMLFLSSASTAVGSVYNTSAKFKRYWQLSAVNDSLARENAELKMRLPNSMFSSLVEQSSFVDSTLELQFQYISADIVNNSVNKSYNYITINTGTKQGVHPNMGVVNATGKGLLGVVKACGKHYSLVASLLNKDIRISARIKRTDYFGMLQWNGEDISKMNLESIPKHADITKGDTVITSGYSSIFPKNLLIGKVDTFYKPPGSNFYSIEISLFNDISKIQYVNVINNLLREEQTSLELKIKTNND
jgi:rod shape-determining protein MreC